MTWGLQGYSGSSAPPRTGRALGLAGLAVALVGTGLLATASPAAAEPQLSVEVGYGGQILPGRSFPVRVTIDADRLVRGTLTVRSSAVGTMAEVTSALPIEVAAGAKKTFVMVIPSSPFFGNQDGATVNLDAGGLHLKRTVTGAFQPDTELVGVLPELFARSSPPSTTSLTVDAGTARIVPLDAQALGVAGALDPLDVIVTDERSWSSVAPADRARVLGWVAGGGRLLVDAADGTLLDGVPSAWRTDATRRASADAGEVQLTGATGAPWWSLLEPTPTRSWFEDAQLGKGGFIGVPVASGVARDAGVRLARIGWLTGFLVVYLLLVGPGVYLALRRRRRSGYLWVVVPATAAVFTIGAWVAGRTLHHSSQAAHATVLVQDATGGSATTWLGRTSNNGGRFALALPDGWALASLSELGDTSSASSAQLTEGAGGRSVSQSILAGGFSVVKTTGPMQPDGGLVVQASSTTDGQVKGTVRNAGKVALDQVAVFAGRSATTIGRIEAGAELPFEIVAGDADPTGQPAEMLAWPGATGFGPPDASNDVVSAGAISEVAQALGSNFRAFGLVQAIGWTRELHPPLLGDVLPGRTAVVANAIVRPSGAPTDMSILRQVLRAPGMTGAAEQQVVLAFTLPDGASSGELTLHAPVALGTIEIWSGGAWQKMATDVVAPADDPSTSTTSVASTAVTSTSTSTSTTTTSTAVTDTTEVPLPRAKVQVGPVPAPPPAPVATAVFAGQGGSVGALGSVTIPASAFVRGRLFVRASTSNGPGFLLDAVLLSGAHP